MERQKDLRSRVLRTHGLSWSQIAQGRSRQRAFFRDAPGVWFSQSPSEASFFPVANAGAAPQAAAALAPCQFHLWLPWWPWRIFSTSHITPLSSELWVLLPWPVVRIPGNVHSAPKRSHFTMWLTSLSFEKPWIQLKTFWPALRDVSASKLA